MDAGIKGQVVQLVIDKNSFESPEFEEFMTDPRSIAVVTDYALMESYTGNSLLNIHRTIQPLSKNTDRVILLRSITEICGIDPQEEGWLDRFEHDNAKADLELFCEQVEHAVKGNSVLVVAVEEHAEVATKHLDRLMEDAETVGLAFLDIADVFGRDTYKALYDVTASSEQFEMLTGAVFKMTADFFQIHPSAGSPPSEMKDIRNTYFFRYSLAGVLLALRWVGMGISRKALPKAKKIRNDIIDANYIVCATYYDGLLTGDQKMLELYEMTEALLNHFYTDDFGTPPAT